VDYPTAEEEASMMERWGQVTKQPELKPVSSGEELLSLRTQVDQIHVSPAVQAYILALVRSSRDLAAQAEGNGPGGARRLLNFGASPRASLALFQAGRALAWLRGVDYLSPALVQEIFHDALRHRVGLTYEAEAEGLSTDKVLDQVLIRTPVPAKV
jgi:MoxR-like ATPase